MALGELFERLDIGQRIEQQFDVMLEVPVPVISNRIGISLRNVSIRWASLNFDPRDFKSSVTEFTTQLRRSRQFRRQDPLSSPRKHRLRDALPPIQNDMQAFQCMLRAPRPQRANFIYLSQTNCNVRFK